MSVKLLTFQGENSHFKVKLYDNRIQQ
jgi:hypothetical protein